MRRSSYDDASWAPSRWRWRPGRRWPTRSSARCTAAAATAAAAVAAAAAATEQAAVAAAAMAASPMQQCQLCPVQQCQLGGRRLALAFAQSVHATRFLLGLRNAVCAAPATAAQAAMATMPAATGLHHRMPLTEWHSSSIRQHRPAAAAAVSASSAAVSADRQHMSPPAVAATAAAPAQAPSPWTRGAAARQPRRASRPMQVD